LLQFFSRQEKKKKRRDHSIFPGVENKRKGVISHLSELSQLISRVMQDADDFNELEEKPHKMLMEAGRAILQAVLAAMDTRLMRKRAEGLRSLGERERAVITRFGTVKIKRRCHRDAQGRGRFLPDEALGWESGLAMTEALEARALKMCSESSFRRSADDLSFFLS
jgi:hypothetical protein